MYLLLLCIRMLYLILYLETKYIIINLSCNLWAIYYYSSYSKSTTTKSKYASGEIIKHVLCMVFRVYADRWRSLMLSIKLKFRFILKFLNWFDDEYKFLLRYLKKNVVNAYGLT